MPLHAVCRVIGRFSGRKPHQTHSITETICRADRIQRGLTPWPDRFWTSRRAMPHGCVGSLDASRRISGSRAASLESGSTMIRISVFRGQAGAWRCGRRRFGRCRLSASCGRSLFAVDRWIWFSWAIFSFSMVARLLRGQAIFLISRQLSAPAGWVGRWERAFVALLPQRAAAGIGGALCQCSGWVPTICQWFSDSYR